MGNYFQNRNSIQAKKLIDNNVVLMMKAALEKVLDDKHESRRKREVPGELNPGFYDVESLQVGHMSSNYKWSRSDENTLNFNNFSFSRIIIINNRFNFQENAKNPGPNDESMTDAMFSPPSSVYFLYSFLKMLYSF